MRDEIHFKNKIFSFHFKSRKNNLISSGLSTFQISPGTLRHHSSSITIFSHFSMIFGLIIKIVLKLSSL
ncbi:TPA: hypothetical protein DEG21_02650 [Patescibacteria group bacterium]|nr:hypothetical protein [Candidatus Gracilibacteria bacterium]HBY74774.1 hypothetical protein [Candidatus Gracilibacteria bacterium]